MLPSGIVATPYFKADAVPEQRLQSFGTAARPQAFKPRHPCPRVAAAAEFADFVVTGPIRPLDHL